MMTLTYIFHSGFLLESERSILVFDFWMDPTEAMRQHMNTRKHVYVFSSHFHEDHFTKEIFRWRESIPHITYILSKDILKHRRAQRKDADVWMAKGSVWEDDNVKVMATGSNDSGVSWIVEVEGKRIFHAGDLCNWYARFLAEAPEGRNDGMTEAHSDVTIRSEEFGEINPVAEEKRFLGELKDIKKLCDKFDLVMFPVDGRIGNGYTRGGRQFIERFKIGLFVPMHFVASGFESAWRMKPFCEEKGVRFWSIGTEGETYELGNALQTFIENEILPRYGAFDKAHQQDHACSVIEQSMNIAPFYDVDPNMVYAIAAYHDLGLQEDRKTHHLVSGQIVREDVRLREWFTPEQIETMAQAVEDHRASSDHEPRSIYGKIVAEADRLIDTGTIIRRTVQFGFKHYPHLDREAHIRRALDHLDEKYAEGGYLKLWIPESPNAERLKALQQLIKDRARIREIVEQIYQQEINSRQ